MAGALAPFLHAPGTTLELIQRLGVALAVGFLVGVERGWRRRDEAAGTRAAGLRTFALSGLYGGLAGVMGLSFGALTLAAALAAYAAALILFELREAGAEAQVSATSTVAGLATVALGALAIVVPTQAVAAAAVALVLLLAFREGLHSWLGRLTWEEIRSALILLAMTFIIAPILPDHAVDPWGAVEPRALWWITVLLGCASFAGYVALRALPSSSGLALSAVVGAVVSSTAVTFDLSQRVKSGDVEPRPAASAALAASAMMLTRTAVLLSLMAPAAALAAAPALAAAFVVTLSIAALFRWSGTNGAAAPARAPVVGSPLDLVEVARFGLILAGLTVASRLVGQVFGAGALLPFAAIAGFADLDAATLAIARTPGAAPLAGVAVMIAAAANTVLKSGVALTLGGRRFGVMYVAGSVLALGAGAGGWWIARALGP